MYGERSYNNHIEVIRDINTFGGEVNPEQLIGELGNKLEGGHLTYLNELRSDALHSYITNYRKLFNEEKECAVTPCELFEVVTKEQQLFAYLKNNHKHAMIRYASKDYKVCDAANVLAEQPELLQDTQKIIVESQKEHSMTDAEIMRTLKSSINIKDIYTILDKKLENHYIRTNLEWFRTAKIEANSPEEIIAIITKEQDFLSGLHDNIKYPKEQKDIKEVIDQAFAQKSDQIVNKLDISVKQALERGIKTSDEIAYELKNSGDLKSIYIDLDRRLEAKHIETSLSNFNQQKLEANSPEEIMNILSKEQSFLAALSDNLQYRDIHSYSLLDKINKACAVKEGNVISLLQKAVDASIETGFKDTKVITCELQNATDLKAAYLNLDQGLESHNIEVTLNNFAASKLAAKLPEELIAILAAEQQYLSGLKDTIKYLDLHPQSLLDRVQDADLGRQNNIIPALQKTVDASIKAGFKDRLLVAEELKNAGDLKSVYVSLDKELESRLIARDLNDFSNRKAQAKTLPEVMQITSERQQFLALVHNTIKYKDAHSQGLLDLLEKAHSGQQDKTMQKLHNLCPHLTKHKIILEQDLLIRLKNSDDIHTIVKELTKLAVDHHASFVNNNISRLLKGDRFKMDNKIFDCPMKYLRHEIKNPAHAYADITLYKKSIPRLQKIMDDFEFKKGGDRSMGGMSM